MLDESIGHFRVSGLFWRFFMKILLVNIVGPDQTPHDVASDLSLHCLLITFLQVSTKNGLTRARNLT